MGVGTVTPSIAVAVARGNEILWEEGFGWIDHPGGTAATPHTLYYVASVTKTITATALMILHEPLRYVNSVRDTVHQAHDRIPLTKVKTQAAEIDQTINQEIVFAKLCTGFAILALGIAGVGLYGTMTYTVARRTAEIGIRMALGAQPVAVVWMVLREVLMLAAVGLAISVPTALGTSKFVESFLLV
jgi:ABC-type antimicrobial peptide transport system permease subunit